MLYSRPDLLHRMLEINAQAVTAYLNAQIESGVAGGDAVRHLGRCAVARGLSRVLAAVSASSVCEGLHRSHDGQTFRASCSPRAAACGWRAWPTSVRTAWAWIGPWTSAAARAARRRQGRAAGQSRSRRAVRRRPRSCAARRPKSWPAIGRGQRPRVQSGTRRVAAHAAGQRRRAGGRRARAEPAVPPAVSAA